MKTDEAIYTYLSTGAEAFRILTGGMTLCGSYRFHSITLKALERRADGVFEPDDPGAPTFVIEFQAQPKPAAWYNLIAKVGLIGESRPETDVIGVLIFLHEADDPGHPRGLVSDDGAFRAVYLNRFLPELLAREPDNPYVAVFAPLVIERDEELKAQAPRLWQAVQSAPIPEPIRLTLAEVLEFWFFERFRNLTPEEVWTMLNQLTPLEETRAYRDIFARGRAAGKTEGRTEGKCESLKLVLQQRFGALPDCAAARIAAATPTQLDGWLVRMLDADGIEALLGPAPADDD